MKVDCKSCSRSINTSSKTVERFQTMSTRPFEFLAEKESCKTLTGERGMKRKVDDTFHRASDRSKPSTQRKRIKVSEMENTNDTEMTSFQDKTSSGGRGVKRKADDAFQSVSGGVKPSAHQKRIKVAELENTREDADTETSSSGGRGVKRKADDDLQSVSDRVKPYALRKRIKAAEMENISDTEMTSYEKKTSSGGRGVKRKADDAFQSVSGGVKPSALRKRIKVSELENTREDADTEPSSSGGRGVKRKADDDLQSVSDRVKPYALRKRIKAAETCSDENSRSEVPRGQKRKAGCLDQDSRSLDTVAAKRVKTAAEDSSSGGRGEKRKADDDFQSDSDGGKPSAHRKRIKVSGMTPITREDADTETSSSAPRGQKRKAGCLDQDSRNEDTVAAKQTKATQTEYCGCSGWKNAKEYSSSGSILDKYVLGKKLGQGYGGTVYLATRKSDGQKVAIKVVNKKYYGVLCHVAGYNTHVIPEARNMMVLKRPPLCPHIIELYEYAMEGRNNYLVMEYASSYITLAKLLKKNNGRLGESVARQLIMQLIIATQRCLEHGIHHLSVHNENILVNPKTLQLKLIDFGNSYYTQKGYWRSPYLGVTRYRQQEREPYRATLFAVESYVMDVRQLLSYMVSGYPCFSKYGRPRFHPSLSAECKDLLWWVIRFHSRTGPVLEEIIEHKWFSMT
ncbi:uncharacterized protein isoform X2 [Danio rerio]|uniref:Uncharacterized protein isoform X2 n=5 Tax=Danio rerio TaxID=7955 RepID=A0AC58HHZ5_DANRE